MYKEYSDKVFFSYCITDCTLFYFTFQCLDRLTWKSTWEASQDAHNRSKNRYCNIVACKLKMLSLYGYTIALAVKCETIFQFFYSVFLCECLRQF